MVHSLLICKDAWKEFVENGAELVEASGAFRPMPGGVNLLDQEDNCIQLPMHSYVNRMMNIQVCREFSSRRGMTQTAPALYVEDRNTPD